MSNKKQNFYNLIISVCALLCMWLVWVIAWLIVDDGYVIPSFTDTVKEIGALTVSSEFWQAFGLTLARTAISWLAATVLAAAVASAGAVFPAVRVRRNRPQTYRYGRRVQCSVWRAPCKNLYTSGYAARTFADRSRFFAYFKSYGFGGSNVQYVQFARRAYIPVKRIFKYRADVRADYMHNSSRRHFKLVARFAYLFHAQMDGRGRSPHKGGAR